MTRLAVLLICLVQLSGCTERTAPSSEQDQGLNEADAMLNEAPNGLESVDEEGLEANAEGNAP